MKFCMVIVYLLPPKIGITKLFSIKKIIFEMAPFQFFPTGLSPIFFCNWALGKGVYLAHSSFFFFQLRLKPVAWGRGERSTGSYKAESGGSRPGRRREPKMQEKVTQRNEEHEFGCERAKSAIKIAVGWFPERRPLNF